ncbi:hypothetical protein N8724_06305 [Candidatus Pelagibacter sp.]|nr:hypothetical protein [Candidatus Pelagibacter sp.]
MEKKIIPPKYIIVLGTTASGSGAIYDYLTGRGDFHVPMMSGEYQLPQAPNGLMALEAAAGKAFHPGTADFALIQFENIAKKLEQSRTIYSPGKGFGKNLKSFHIAIEQFVSEITSANYPMHLEWHRLMLSPIQHFINLLKRRFGFKEPTPLTRLLVSPNELVAAAQKLHDRIFQPEKKNYPILLNQAGSGWNPIESTKYFSSRKVILVTRDPRDQFVEIKKNKEGTSVEGFIEWYIEMRKRLKEINNPVLLHISFEDFVVENKKFLDLLCNHILIDPKIKSSYEPKLSLKNIGKYHQFLNQKELDLIENRLSTYIYTKLK